MAGRSRILASMWKKLMKDVDIEEPTSFLDHVFFVLHIQRRCKPNEKIVEKTDQQYKVSHPCLNDHQIRKEELEMLVLGTKWST